MGIKQVSPIHFHLSKLGGLVIVVNYIVFFNMEEKIEFLFSEDIYKYVDLEINEDNLFSHGISKKADIEKSEAINLLTKKIDFDSLELLLK